MSAADKTWLHYKKPCGGGGNHNNEKTRHAQERRHRHHCVNHRRNNGGGGGIGPQGPAGVQGAQGADADATTALIGNEMMPYSSAGQADPIESSDDGEVVRWVAFAQTEPTDNFTAAAFTMTREGRVTSLDVIVEGLVTVPSPLTEQRVLVQVWVQDPLDIEPITALGVIVAGVGSTGNLVPGTTNYWRAQAPFDVATVVLPGYRVSVGVSITTPEGGTFTFDALSGSISV